MTAEDIAALSGRELDAAIHEQFMGDVFMYWCGPGGCGTVYSNELKKHSRRKCVKEGKTLSGPYDAFPHYTADDFRGVSLMLNKLRADGWDIEMGKAAKGNLAHGYWSVMVYRSGPKSRTVLEINDTLPVALGRAALMTTLRAK